MQDSSTSRQHQQARQVTDLTLTVKRKGQKIEVWGMRGVGIARREAEVKCGSVPAAKALLRFMEARPIGQGEGLEAWIQRCARDYERAVWVRLGKGSRR